jgi:hypothetical protein
METGESIFAAENGRRKHYEVEALIRDFELRAENLMKEIRSQEQVPPGDPNRFAYASYARHALLRHSNLLSSIEKLKLALHPQKSAA